MNPSTALAIQLVASAVIVLAVLFIMWRMPKKGEALFGWGPPLALVAPWAGLIGLALSSVLWFLPEPDAWLVAIFLVLDPAAIACGTLVLWIYRDKDDPAGTIEAQRLQAKVGITLGLIAVIVGYAFVMTHKKPFTFIGF